MGKNYIASPMSRKDIRYKANYLRKLLGLEKDLI